MSLPPGEDPRDIKLSIEVNDDDWFVVWEMRDGSQTAVPVESERAAFALVRKFIDDTGSEVFNEQFYGSPLQ